MVEVKEERFTDWRGILRSFFGGSINRNSNNEEYKQWEKMNATDVKASSENIKALEEGTSVPKDGGGIKRQRRPSKTQIKSTQMPINNRKIRKESKQRNNDGISR